MSDEAVSYDVDTPLISVVIATRNRSALLRESLHSVLSQTYQNIEVIVVDDGSEDDTESMVTDIDDSRVRYVKQDWGGISKARNTGTCYAKGEWLAVHDDDDLMLPYRLEHQMLHIDDDVDFIYGAFINFDDGSGALELHHGRNYGFGPALKTGFAPGHSTWLVRTGTMRSFPYDEGLESAVDNNVCFRMLRSGVRFLHSGVVCVLRRVHSGRITDTGAGGQKYGAHLNLRYLQARIPEKKVKQLWDEARFDWGPVDKEAWQVRHLPYLPDHLVKRSGILVSYSMSDPDSSDAIVATVRGVANLSWFDLYEHLGRRADLSHVSARLRETEEVETLIADIEVSDDVCGVHATDVGESVLLTQFNAERTEQFVVLTTAPVSQWTPEARALMEVTCRIDGDVAESRTGMLAVRTLAAVEALRDGTLSWATSFRVVSTGSVSATADAIIAENR